MQEKRSAAESMQITAPDLKKLGVIDEVIPEPKGGAHRDIDEQAVFIDQVLEKSLKELKELSSEDIVEERWQKYKKIGSFQTV